MTLHNFLSSSFLGWSDMMVIKHSTLSSDMDEGTCVLFCLAFKSNLLCILSNSLCRDKKERRSWDYFDDTYPQKLMSTWKTHTQAWWLSSLPIPSFLASVGKVCNPKTHHDWKEKHWCSSKAYSLWERKTVFEFLSLCETHRRSTAVLLLLLTQYQESSSVR